MTVDGARDAEAPSSTDGVPRPGDVVGGKFVVERVLGVGGMGIVVAARHLQLGQTVAIKFLHRAAAGNGEAVARFVREARAAVSLQSAHVVRVMDVGALHDGLPYMVMEHLGGTDLGQVLEARRMLPVEEAVDYLLQAMEAVAEAHALGIVHRDLKPSNLFLTVRPDGTPHVKVLDFGISKAVDDGSQPQSLTSTAMVMGSPLYMSPEQVRSTKTVDTRTDIWALGVILYELLTGSPPFEADTVTALCAKIVADPPVPLRARRPNVPGGLGDVVARCLDKEVKRRFQSVAALAAGLRSYASLDGKLAADRVSRIGTSSSSGSHRSTSVAPPLNGAVEGLASGYSETVASRETTSGIRWRRSAVVAAGLVAVAVAAVAVVRARHVDRGQLAPSPIAHELQAAAMTTVASTTPEPAREPAIHPPAEAVASSAAALTPVAAPSALPADSAKPLRPVRAVATTIHAAPPKPVASKPSADDLLLDRK